MTSNPTVSANFRNSVLLALHELGHVSARAVPSDRFQGREAPGKACVIEGVPGWLLMTRAERKPLNFSEALLDADRLAAITGATRSVVVLPRRGYPSSDAYVLSTLSDFTSALAPLIDRRTA